MSEHEKQSARALEEQQPPAPVSEMIPKVEPLQLSQIDLNKIAPTREERLFLVLSIFIGVISGLLVVSFRMAIEWLSVMLQGPAPGPH